MVVFIMLVLLTNLKKVKVCTAYLESHTSLYPTVDLNCSQSPKCMDAVLVL